MTHTTIGSTFDNLDGIPELDYGYVAALNTGLKLNSHSRYYLSMQRQDTYLIEVDERNIVYGIYKVDELREVGLESPDGFGKETMEVYYTLKRKAKMIRVIVSVMCFLIILCMGCVLVYFSR